MHEYYSKNIHKIRKEMDGLLGFVSKELEEYTKKSYGDVFEEIWNLYKSNMLEYFPYIGGNKVSGTKNLTGSYMFVAMGEVLKEYGVSVKESGYLMVLSFERRMKKVPSFVIKFIKRMQNHPKIFGKIMTKAFKKKDKKNYKNALKNPGSFKTKTMIPPEDGYHFSYHNLVCPLAEFAKKYGYEEYMPYLCNLDYVSFAVLGIALYRSHTVFEDGDYCDFKIKCNAPILEYWPPVYTSNNGYK